MSRDIQLAGEEPKLPHIVSVQYPAIVQNDDKMLETLGGIRKISEVRVQDMFINYKFIYIRIF